MKNISRGKVTEALKAMKNNRAIRPDDTYQPMGRNVQKIK